MTHCRIEWNGRGMSYTPSDNSFTQERCKCTVMTKELNSFQFVATTGQWSRFMTDPCSNISEVKFAWDLFVYFRVVLPKCKGKGETRAVLVLVSRQVGTRLGLPHSVWSWSCWRISQSYKSYDYAIYLPTRPIATYQTILCFLQKGTMRVGLLYSVALF